MTACIFLKGATTVFPSQSLFFFLGWHLWHMEVPSGQNAAAAAGLCHSHSNTRSNSYLQPTPEQHWILKPLSEASDQMHTLMDIGWVFNPQSHNGKSLRPVFYVLLAHSLSPSITKDPYPPFASEDMVTASMNTVAEVTACAF